jgi:FkbM family methyltransferase
VTKLSLDGLRPILAFDNWPILLLERLFDRKTGFVGYRKDGRDILIDYHGGDQGGTRMCIVSDTYRRYLPSMKLPGPARVLDLGANGGGFPLMLSIAGVPLERVVCVEMNPMTYLRLQLNLATNLGPSAVAVNAAVSGMPRGSEILLKPNRGSTGESMYGNRAESAAAHVSVKTTNLRSLYEEYFANENIDICKIDIEGAEYEVFASTSDDMLRMIRYLIIEFHDSANRMRPLLERILAIGFADMTIERGSKTSYAAEVRMFRGPLADIGASAA